MKKKNLYLFLFVFFPQTLTVDLQAAGFFGGLRSKLRADYQGVSKFVESSTWGARRSFSQEVRKKKPTKRLRKKAETPATKIQVTADRSVSVTASGPFDLPQGMMKAPFPLGVAGTYFPRAAFLEVKYSPKDLLPEVVQEAIDNIFAGCQGRKPSRGKFSFLREHYARRSDPTIYTPGSCITPECFTDEGRITLGEGLSKTLFSLFESAGLVGSGNLTFSRLERKALLSLEAEQRAERELLKAYKKSGALWLPREELPKAGFNLTSTLVGRTYTLPKVGFFRIRARAYGAIERNKLIVQKETNHKIWLELKLKDKRTSGKLGAATTKLRVLVRNKDLRRYIASGLFPASQQVLRTSKSISRMFKRARKLEENIGFGQGIDAFEEILKSMAYEGYTFTPSATITASRRAFDVSWPAAEN